MRLPVKDYIGRQLGQQNMAGNTAGNSQNRNSDADSYEQPGYKTKLMRSFKESWSRIYFKHIHSHMQPMAGSSNYRQYLMQ